ncbi:MAG: hypothetical protein AAFV53_38730 [Myxococcota bacterium]
MSMTMKSLMSSSTTASSEAASSDSLKDPLAPTIGGPRTVNGAGGYRYEQHPNGDIVILSGGDISAPVRLTSGKAWTAITNEIGPFPTSSSSASSGASTGTTTSDVKEDKSQKSMLDQFADMASSIGKAWSETVTDIQDQSSSIWNYWFGSKDDEAETATRNDTVTSSGSDDSKKKSKAPTLDSSDTSDVVAYLNQRDNDYDESSVFDKRTKRIYGDVMCNVTTLAMQLQTLAGDPDQIKSATIDLLMDKGYSGDREGLVARQLEDLLMMLYELLGESYFEKNCPGYKANSSFGPHQYMICLQHVAEMFPQYVKGTKGLYGNVDSEGHLKKDPATFYNDEVMPHFKSGAVMLSTKLTGGHIVLLADILSNGIVINDPYGMRMPGGYVKNGKAASKYYLDRIADAGGTYGERLSQNDRLKDQVDAIIQDSAASKFPDNLGEQNFYSWKEVREYAIGKWVSALDGE